MLRKEQIEYALHYADNPVEWVFGLVHGLEKRIDELLKFGTKVTVFQEHWHPASEFPKLGEDDNNEFIVIASVDNDLYRHGPMIDKPKKAKFIDGQWTEPNVKWWCYPPKEEE